jgi:hypothetical protein
MPAVNRPASAAVASFLLMLIEISKNEKKCLQALPNYTNRSVGFL